MMTTLALAAVLSLTPNQAETLKLTNPRATYGFLGAARTDNKLLPGDAYFVTFDIENLKADDEGRVRYSMGMELTNSEGKTQFKREPTEQTANTSLGGRRLPAFAVAQVGTDTSAGKYMLTVTVTDVEAKATQQLKREFEVMKKGFGLVQLHTTYLQAPVPAPPVGVTGQSLLVNCFIVGFERDAKTKQPNIYVEIVVLDDKGKPTLVKPFTDQVTKDVDAELMLIPVALPLELNRAGKYKVKLKAEDRISKKTTELTFPIEVLELK